MTYTVIDDSGKNVVTKGSAQDVLDFTNCLFEYDRRDADADEETDIVTAIKELIHCDFNIKTQP